MKVLFVGADCVYVSAIRSKLKREEVVLLSAITREEVETVAVSNPDITLVIFLGHIVITRRRDIIPGTVRLIKEISRMFGDGVRMISASTNGMINRSFMSAGCNETVYPDRLCEYLSGLFR